jgi:hypothetical protein
MALDDRRGINVRSVGLLGWLLSVPHVLGDVQAPAKEPVMKSVAWILPLAVAATFGPLSAVAGQDGSGIDESVAIRRGIDWDKRLAEAVPRKNQPLYVIVHSARDCHFCQRWKGGLGVGGPAEFREWAKDHPLAKLAIVERDNIDGVETEDRYPPELMLFYEKRKESGSLRTGVPLFEIALGRRVIHRAYGFSSWRRSVFDAVKLVESRRGQVPTQAQRESLRD